MRIIAGQWRGRPLQSPKGDATRPTADRTRETLFSMLVSRIGSFEGTSDLNRLRHGRLEFEPGRRRRIDHLLESQLERRFPIPVPGDLLADPCQEHLDLVGVEAAKRCRKLPFGNLFWREVGHGVVP